MSNLNQITSPLDQFEIRNLLSLDAPIFGNLHISLTNIGLYLTIGAFSVLTLNLLTLYLLTINYNKYVSNSDYLSIMYSVITSMLFLFGLWCITIRLSLHYSLINTYVNLYFQVWFLRLLLFLNYSKFNLKTFIAILSTSLLFAKSNPILIFKILVYIVTFTFNGSF